MSNNINQSTSRFGPNKLDKIVDKKLSNLFKFGKL